MSRWLKLGSLSVLLVGMCWQYAFVCVDPGRLLAPFGYYYEEYWYEYPAWGYAYEPPCCGWMDPWWFP